VLSFDSLAQDVLRKKGSFKKTVSMIEEILHCPDIGLEINSVFTPATIDYLSDSVKFIMDLGVPDIHFALSMIKPWDQVSLLKFENEMMKLRNTLVDYYRRRSNIPVSDFREDSGNGISYCGAGKNRLAITPDEKIWGCFLFPDYFKGKENSVEHKNFFYGPPNFFKLCPTFHGQFFDFPHGMLPLPGVREMCSMSDQCLLFRTFFRENSFLFM
jgi:hypothetical protein